MGSFTDVTGAFCSVVVCMLVLGAVAPRSERGITLPLGAAVVAVLVGPLQHVTTELSCDVVHALSENPVCWLHNKCSPTG